MKLELHWTTGIMSRSFPAHSRNLWSSSFAGGWTFARAARDLHHQHFDGRVKAGNAMPGG